MDQKTPNENLTIQTKQIAILTSPTSWFIPHAKKFLKKLIKNKYSAQLFLDHKDIPKSYNVVFILSYFKIIEQNYLDQHKYNLVVHESKLPKGRGWAPLFWQILKGKNKIPIVLFEASKKADSGNIYLRDNICLTGKELYNEIRKKQAKKTIELCLKFLEQYPSIKTEKQKGTTTTYRKRTPKDSELNINKSLKHQFNILRVSNNKDFPAFFYHNRTKYIIYIFKLKEKNES